MRESRSLQTAAEQTYERCRDARPEWPMCARARRYARRHAQCAKRQVPKRHAQCANRQAPLATRQAPSVNHSPGEGAGADCC